MTAGEEILDVCEPADVGRVRRATRVLASQIGFDRTAAESPVLASIELATNLLRHAGGGTLRVFKLEDSRHGAGIGVESVDAGPGIASVEQAMSDGFSTAGGLGGGLPGVRRLMDEVTIETAPGHTRIVAKKWLAQR